jgi:hypothetical protein
MPLDQKPILDLQKFLESQGTFIADIDPESGAVKVDGRTGSGYLDIDGFASALGVDRDSLQINKPESAIDRSPLSANERADLSFGNFKGSKDYLSKKFEAVSYSPDKGMVVKDKGIWYTVDPSALGSGDPWEKTKELYKDVMEFAPMFAAKAAGVTAAAAPAAKVGAAIGTAFGPVGTAVGGVVGGAIGAGAAAFAMRGVETSFGRAIGTYEATPEEQLSDAALEGAFAAGGYVVGVGAKASWDGVKGALTKVSKASGESKDLLAQFVAHTNKIKPQSAERLFSNPQGVNKHLDRFVGKGFSDTQVEEALRLQNIRGTKTLFNGLGDDIFKQFDELENTFLQTMPKNFSAPAGPLLQQPVGVLASNGFIRPQLNGATGQLVGFAPVAKPEFMKLFSAQVSPLAANKAYNALRELSSIGNKMLKKGNLSAHEALTFRRALDKLVFKSRVFQDEAVRDTLSPATSSLRNELVKLFTKTSPQAGDAYARMNQFWIKNMETATRAERVALTTDNTASFVRKIASPDSYAEASELLSKVAKLRGRRGEVVKETILNREAAREFSRRLPSLGLLQSAAIGSGVGFATGDVELGFAVGAGSLAMSSPRMLARLSRSAMDPASKSLPYVRTVSRNMKAIAVTGGKAADVLLDPSYLAVGLGSAMNAAQEEDEAVKALLQEKGL